MPTGQSEHVVAPLTAYVVIAQDLHVTVEPDVSRYVPPAQDAHELAPAAEPVGHVAQVEDPAAALYVFAPHGEQLDAPPELYVPAAHFVSHVFCPELAW